MEVLPMPKNHAIKILPPAEHLRECFSYNPDSGVLTWKTRPRDHFANTQAWVGWNTKHAGKPAGKLGTAGYRYVAVGHRWYLTHRVIWKLTTGKEPPHKVDHKDNDQLNNRWINLRPATDSQSQWNQRLYKTNTTGHKGVKRMRDKWQARIVMNNVERHLGTFDTFEEAVSVREAAAYELRGEFCRER
jgi:hypothetical protein